MTKRLTAEQVAAALDARKRWQIEFGSSVGADAYRTAETLVRANLVETDEQRRERFERWCAKYDWDIERLRSGEYASGLTHDLWGTWQSALTWHGETEGGGE